jgi:hypothetical protein
MSLTRTKLLGIASVGALALLAGSMAIAHLTGTGFDTPTCAPSSPSEPPTMSPLASPSPSVPPCPSDSTSPSSHY